MSFELHVPLGVNGFDLVNVQGFVLFSILHGILRGHLQMKQIEVTLSNGTNFLLGPINTFLKEVGKVGMFFASGCASNKAFNFWARADLSFFGGACLQKCLR